MSTALTPALHDANWQVPACTVHFDAGRRRDHCIVIPVLNEGERIRRLLARMQALGLDGLVDVIIVDGGSRDGSLAHGALRELGVATLLEKTGPGKLSAQLRCAYAFALRAGYAGIVTIDGNDKDDPAAVPAFLQALQDGADFVQASRFVPGGVAEHTPLIRHLAIRYLHAPLLAWCSGFPWTDTTQGFRAYSARMLLDPRIAPFRDVFDTYELLAYLSLRVPQLGFRCLELPTTRRYPADGKVPTKISAVRGNLRVLAILVAACRGRFNVGRR